MSHRRGAKAASADTRGLGALEQEPFDLVELPMEQGRESFEGSADYANYFVTYGYLYHQKQMLEDEARMRGYYDAICNNPEVFAGKTVMDVGAGTGVLSIFAIRAGAKKVIAIEATAIAQRARTVIAANGMADQITVIQSTVEELPLPKDDDEKVDVIVSEWMGYFLLRESMLDTVLLARDRFLKPGGVLLPSRCQMIVAPIVAHACSERRADLEKSMQEWDEFVSTTRRKFMIDFSCLRRIYYGEHRMHYLQTAEWRDVEMSDVLGEPSVLIDLDLHKVTTADLLTLDMPFESRALRAGTAQGLCGWFSVQFAGRPEAGVVPRRTVTLSTGPDNQKTHWGQQVFYMAPPVELTVGDVMVGRMKLTRASHNQRLLRFEIERGVRSVAGTVRDTRKSMYALD